MKKRTHTQKPDSYENVCAAYRRQEVSLSRAAELAGLSVYDFLSRFPATGLDFNLTPEELRQETIQQIASA